jgi:large subunit ribosomal protein L30
MARTFVWHPGKGPSTVANVSAKDGEMVRIKQVRSGIGHEARMRRTLEAMGLRGHQAVIERPMSAALRGQIKHVRHLVEVTPAGGASAAPKKPAAKKASKAKATNG